ncbi:MAG: hypothetical protein CM1200mP10_25540 [Candidatus Neomarinimicrobiota bacterium]|nr:MAG: hypothetical protein CM1200mP10_25540 [Candidatus Neomarinimicrobiota bacterium]
MKNPGKCGNCDRFPEEDPEVLVDQILKKIHAMGY